MTAAKSAVNAPSPAMKSITSGHSLKMKKARATRKTPAATIVAAWMSAEVGVGPSIASSSQTWSGNCPDFPIGPMKSSRPITVK